MLRRPFTPSRWSQVARVCLAIVGVVALIAVYLGLGPTRLDAPKPTIAQAVRVVAAAPTDTPEPPPPSATATPTPQPSPTPTSTSLLESTQPPPAVATFTPAWATNTPATTAALTPTQAVKPEKRGAEEDNNILPNGVRYGDHTPNLPGRIVRIASPDVKLDTRVYEVYGTSKGLWEVADYAAGHHYTSKNPGEGGNIVLSGHNNYRGEVFRYLEFLKPGDTINVWTLEGKEYAYRVERTEKLKEAGASMAQRLDNGKVMADTPTEQLTLITCWPYTTYTHRLVVVAKPVE